MQVKTAVTLLKTGHRLRRSRSFMRLLRLSLILSTMLRRMAKVRNTMMKRMVAKKRLKKMNTKKMLRLKKRN